MTVGPTGRAPSYGARPVTSHTVVASGDRIV
jgi:hypothetical protein